MNNILKHISILHNHELYSNVVKLAELTVTVCEQKPDFATPSQKFQLHVYYAEALFHVERYEIAEKNYSQALQTRKYMTKIKSSSNKNIDELKLMTDTEIKFKMYKCYIKLKRFLNAIEILESIPARNRTPKVNMALGNLYKDVNQDRAAITCFKETLKECPLALETAENLLMLDVKGVEVNALMVDVTNEINWINLWLRAKTQMHARDFNNAIMIFKSLDCTGMLKDNVNLLVNMGYCYHYLCNENAAISALQRAVRLNPFLKTGRDLLANLLTTSNDKEYLKDLEKLMPTDNDTSLLSHEDWTVMAYYMYSQKKYELAVFLTEQACKIEKSVEAYLLKARMYTQLNKFYDASSDLRQALLICPYRFDLHKDLVQLYLATSRLREGIAAANNACKQLNNSPPSLTLYASALLKDTMNATKAKGILEKAISGDSPYLPAVYLLIDILKQEHAFEDAIKLIKKIIDNTSSSKLHQLLADCYVRLQKDEEAFHHYNVALRIDPSNQKALEGMDNIGCSINTSKVESTCYVTAHGDSNTYPSQAETTQDNEGDPDSDTDNWPNSGGHIMSFSV
ncbi:anaphase-promoting complex subunit 7 [Agrilus planipennis]|uniref:Anaphase-promoting complex subunit 7 n=1 Tax=Agrilus planipennis TaxID=224129 RepID=A0A1W4WB66_AGRPL|nr:anaphase-promoting complex subunit 7 [Agrilus planipennis]